MRSGPLNSTPDRAAMEELEKCARCGKCRSVCPVFAELRDEARRLGANAIVGFTIDYDNVGAKSKSLLMASARGTAVVI